MTYFWAHMIHFSINSTKNPTGDFKGFLVLNPQLTNSGLFLEYYNKDTMLNSLESRKQVVLPDKKPLPSIISLTESPTQKPVQVIKEIDHLTEEEFITKFESNDSLLEWNHFSLLRIIVFYLTKYGRKNGLNKVFDNLKKIFRISSTSISFDTNILLGSNNLLFNGI